MFIDTLLRDSLTTTKGFSSMSAHDLKAIIEDVVVFSRPSLLTINDLKEVLSSNEFALLNLTLGFFPR